MSNDILDTHRNFSTGWCPLVSPECNAAEPPPYTHTQLHVALLITPELYHYQSYKQRHNCITIIRLLTQVAEKDESHPTAATAPMRWELAGDNCFSRWSCRN